VRTLAESKPTSGATGASATALGQSSAPSVKSIITAYAREIGFDLVRVASAQEFNEDRKVTLDRIRDGLMDGLPWFNKSRVLRGTTPQDLLPGARSIICLGLNYFEGGQDFPGSEAPAGKVARYAWGQDYHKVIKKRMRVYVEGLRVKLGNEFAARWYVDDGPMLDRAAASRAGLGWFGKNTNILTPSLGSWVFLGQVVTDLELEPDQPLKKTCGNCVRCIDACPTGAIVAPYVIDNARCISYLTIENRGEIPLALRPQIGDWVFGCDICQDVCPVNNKTSPAPTLWQRQDISPLQSGGLANSQGNEQRQGVPAEQASEIAHTGRIATFDLLELLEMSEETFRNRFRGSPILRAKRVGLQRNACVALGNRGDPVAVPALRQALFAGEALVRGHAAWALGRIGVPEARKALEQARTNEQDDGVIREIAQALEALGHNNSTVAIQA